MKAQASSGQLTVPAPMPISTGQYANVQDVERSPASSHFDHCSEFSGDSQVLQSGHKREVEFFRACFGNASTACRHNQTLASEFLEDFSDIFWLSVYSRRLLHLGFCRAVMVDERGTQQFLNYEL